MGAFSQKRGNNSFRKIEKIEERNFKNRFHGLIIVYLYALGGMSNKIFTSKYRLQLPDPEILKAEIEHERQRLLEMKIV